MNQPDDDAYFERYLQRKSTLSELYREDPGEQPAAQVDAAILRAAEVEAARRRQPAPRSGWLRWRIIGPVMAALVIAVILPVLMNEDDKPSFGEMDDSPPAARQPRRAVEAERDERVSVPSRAQPKSLPRDDAPATSAKSLSSPSVAGACDETEAITGALVEPAAMIKQIRALKAKACNDQARALRARFLRDFPGFPLPDDLR